MSNFLVLESHDLEKDEDEFLETIRDEQDRKKVYVLPESLESLYYHDFFKCKSCGVLVHKDIIKSIKVMNSGETLKTRLKHFELKICPDCSALMGRKKGREKSNKTLTEKWEDPVFRKEMSERRSGPNHPNWQGGLKFLPYCYRFNKEFKERVRKFWGRKCAICGKNEIREIRRLSVHHVNYDKMTCCNDSVPLFVPLCHSCHLKTNHNREYWENVLTDFIQIWYDGKCYFPKGR